MIINKMANSVFLSVYFALSFVTCRLLMKFYRSILPLLLVGAALFAGAGMGFTQVKAQPTLYKVKGTVYDSTHHYPVQSVSVLTSSGRGTVTSKDGTYTVEVEETDSIWFSYLNKPTKKYPVLKIATPFAFDVSLAVYVPVLAEVTVKNRNYYLDSLQNREDYAKVFNYQKPGLSASVNNSGVGFDLNEIINVFRFRKNRSTMAFQNRLLNEEKEKFVKHRFSKALVRRLTKLEGDSLDYFVNTFVPPYWFVQSADDYTFQKYVKDSGERFKKGLMPLPPYRTEDEDVLQ